MDFYKYHLSVASKNPNNPFWCLERNEKGVYPGRHPLDYHAPIHYKWVSVVLKDATVKENFNCKQANRFVAFGKRSRCFATSYDWLYVCIDCIVRM